MHVVSARNVRQFDEMYLFRTRRLSQRGQQGIEGMVQNGVQHEREWVLYLPPDAFSSTLREWLHPHPNGVRVGLNTHHRQHAATPSERSARTQTQHRSWGACCSISSTPSLRGTTAALTQAHANKEILAGSQMSVLISGSGIVGCWRRCSRTPFQM